MLKSILKEIAKEEQVRYLLLWVGEQGSDMYNSCAFEDEDEREVPAKILDRFMEHLEPRTNHRIHRYILQGIRQDQGESLALRISQPNASSEAVKNSKIEY